MTTPIPYLDFGGEGQIIHFAHPNAYPPACFRQFLTALTASFHVIALEQRPLWPGQQPQGVQHINELVADQIRFFEQEGLQGVIGLGHSWGGVLTMLTAVERPELFSKLILIDPVFLAPSILEAAGQMPDQIANNPFSVRARNRRHRWPDKAAAFAHFRPKTVFADWSDDALWDFVETSLVPDGDGAVTLRFSREWEAFIYASMLTNGNMIWQTVPQLQQPTCAIRAEKSDTLFPEAWTLWQELQPAATFIEVAGVSHMLMMERPLLLADIVRQWLE